MATISVKGIRMAIIDPKTKKVIAGEKGLSEDGIYDLRGRTAMGVSQANITGLAQSKTKIWGNGILQDQSIGKSQPSVALNINNLPHDVLEKVLGHEGDGKGGYLDNANGVLPHIALDIITSSLSGGDVHFCFYDGYMTTGDKNLQTNNENESRDTDNLTYDPVAGDNGHTYKTMYAEDEGFSDEDLLAEFFPKAEAATEKANLKSNKK